MLKKRVMTQKLMIKSKQLRTSFSLGLYKIFAYRLKLVAWVLSGVAEPLIWSVLWFAAAGTGELGLDKPQVFTYYVFVALVARLTWSWTFDDVRDEIFEGRYSRYLLWPSGLTEYRFGMDLSNKVLTLVALLPFWVAFVLFGNSLGLLSVSWGMLPLAVVALMLAILLRFMMDMVLGHVALWLGKTDGLSLAYHAAARILGGIAVPLLFLPVLVRELTFLTPFRYVYSFPVEILMGITSGGDAVWGYVVAIFWLACSFILLQFVSHCGLKRYEAVGI